MFIVLLLILVSIPVPIIIVVVGVAVLSATVALSITFTSRKGELAEQEGKYTTSNFLHVTQWELNVVRYFNHRPTN